MRRFRLLHYLKTTIWLVPLICVAGGVVLSLVTTAVDPDGELVPRSVTGDSRAALQILYLIAFAMLTLTGLVLSLLVLAVQLAMGTFSPRIVRQILQDRSSQAAIGLFAGTFTHALLSMRRVEESPGDGAVPGLAVLVAIVLVLACIATLVWYLNHIAQSLRTAALVAWVAEDTRITLEHIYPDRTPGPPDDPAIVTARTGGVVFTIGYERLVALARESDCRLALLWALGDFVPTGAPLVRIDGDPARLSRADVERSVVLGPERTLNADVAYGIKLLVDIAERSLSSGPFQDPNTAVQAIDRLHDILRQLVGRRMHDGRYHDADGGLRLTVPTLQWDGFVRIAFDEIRQAGAGSPQVSRRLAAALQDLLSVAPPDRAPALERQLALLGEVAAVAAGTAADREEAMVPDPAGIGSADSLVAPGP